MSTSGVLLVAFVAFHVVVALAPRWFGRNFGVYATGLIALMLAAVWFVR